MFIWTEVAQNPIHELNHNFSQQLSMLGVENKYIETVATADTLDAALAEAKTKCEMIRIGAPFKSYLIDSLKHVDLETRMIGSVDTLIKRKDAWWPKSTFYNGMTDVFLKHQGSARTDYQALVVGAGAAARAVCAVVAKMGYNKINLTSRYDEQGGQLLMQLQKIFFDIDFKYIPKDRLVLLPGTNNLVINTTPFIPSNDLLVELYYLNFLRSDGLLVDLNVIPYNTLLIQSGQQVGIKVVHGYEVLALSECALLSLISGKEVDRDAYTAKVEMIVKNQNFDFSGFSRLED
jgi:shikimate dehydrogenase